MGCSIQNFPSKYLHDQQQFLLTFVLEGSIIIIEAKAFIGAFVRSARHKKAEEIVRGSSDAPVIKS